MKLSEKLKNPYFKVSNCTDMQDIKHAIDEIKKVMKEHPESTKAKIIFSKLSDTKDKLSKK